MDYIVSILPTLLSGLKVTAEIFFLTIILSLPLGVLLAIFRVRSWKPVRELVAAYIYVMRGTPLMLQILFIYYGLPLIPGVSIQFGDFTAALLAFVANYAAYFAEIFRGGIQNISRGQYEGAKVLGFTYPQTMRHIILPQVVKRVLAPVGNETITLLKDTSLVYVLAMDDLMRLTRSVVQRDFDTTAFFVAGVIYLICTFFLTKILTRLEKHFAVYED
ncbi:MAG: amino acid ABC transporter permease [Negativicoccus succinicivorans]|uniref:amino acid ABC transporter permease n=1 Tax=Negativicoccus succinicivorans TaxID=620903 RepID=UPI00290928E9|nr:amino acid ABC transporter permease [Negativicoccus succinicivorans]MDU4558458.1 amino acid ABC transporter permease [Negativicoccus succinicivorans]MDU4576212.1 amino acid ABC transporter permease [Negativicoccus succinicivorans]